VTTVGLYVDTFQGHHGLVPGVLNWGNGTVATIASFSCLHASELSRVEVVVAPVCRVDCCHPGDGLHSVDGNEDAGAVCGDVARPEDGNSGVIGLVLSPNFAPNEK